MKSILIFAAMSGIFGLLLNPGKVWAQDIEKIDLALNVIRDHANKQCRSISLNTSTKSTKFNTDLKADVSNLIKKLIDLKIDAAGNYSTTESSGLLVADLLPALKNEDECKKYYFDKLIDRLIPKISEKPYLGKVTTPPSSRKTALPPIPKKATIRLLSLDISKFSYGASNLAVIAINISNTGDVPVRITNVKVKVEKIFRFEVPMARQFRIPASGVYHLSLANLWEGEEISTGFLHEIPIGSADRLILVLGGQGFINHTDDSLKRGDPSYLAKIKIFLLAGEEIMLASSNISVLVINQDKGHQIKNNAFDQLNDKITKLALPIMTEKNVINDLYSIGLTAPEWLTEK